MKPERSIKLEVSPQAAEAIDRLARIHGVTVDEYLSQVLDQKYNNVAELAGISTPDELADKLIARGILIKQ